MIRVVKLGGSLLTLTDLATRLADWLEQQSPATNVIVVGGGSLVDCVRKWDESFSLDSEFTHATCLDLMSLTSRLLAQLLPQTRVLTSIPQILAAGEIHGAPRDPLIFDLAGFAHQRADVLPPGWEITSDSLSAALANEVDAEHLVLLKSALPRSLDLRDWSGEGFVDVRFAALAGSIEQVTVVNLSSQDPQANTLHVFPDQTTHGHPGGFHSA